MAEPDPRATRQATVTLDDDQRLWLEARLVEERGLSGPRALIDGTDPLDANRAHAVDIAVTITQALERQGGE